MNVIGCGGLSRVGKDTFCAIAKDILEANGFKAKQYRFADELKDEVNPFLTRMCGIDAFTQNPEEKKDIRDFLVWYGTTFWRKRDPLRWIRVLDNQLKLDGNSIDIALVSDVRYPNEADWVHSWGGYLVHVSAYKMHPRIPTSSVDNGPGPEEPLVRGFITAPNEQEQINDPLVKAKADYKLEWEDKGLSQKKAERNEALRAEVLVALNSCHLFSDALHRW